MGDQRRRMSTFAFGAGLPRETHTKSRSKGVNTKFALVPGNTYKTFCLVLLGQVAESAAKQLGQMMEHLNIFSANVKLVDLAQVTDKNSPTHV